MAHDGRDRNAALNLERTAMQPLKGLTVVTLEHAIAAPFCTRQLADLGARVIKIERPGVGDFARGYDERVRGLASHFVWTNRSKESLTLDVKHAKLPLASSHATPRSSHTSLRRAMTCRGNASSTSFATTAPLIAAGSPSSQTTRLAYKGDTRASVARWRSRRSGDGSSIA